MTNVEKVSRFLDEAKVFYFLTTDGSQPKGRPFGFHLIYQDKLYFGCGTFKNVFAQLTKNPKVEVLAVNGSDFLRYDGEAVVVRDDGLMQAVREAAPQIMSLYDKNGWEMGMFYLQNGQAEIRGLFEQKEAFEV